jgi:hypothetical protein
MNEYAEILKYKSTDKGTELLVLVPDKDIKDYLRRFAKGGKVKTELRLDDPRYISSEQRKKARALIADIALYTGFEPDFLHKLMKCYYCIENSNEDYFSLSDCSVTTARNYINYLINFCFEYDIPFMDKGLNRTDDINAYLYACIKHRRCSLCNKSADIHHVTGSRIGMGSNRKKVSHSQREVIALCREHHNLVHAKGEEEIFEKYKVYGIVVDAEMLKELGYKADEIKEDE